MKTAALALGALLIAGSAQAQTIGIDQVPINETTSLFCRDASGEPRLQTYANLGGVIRRYKQRFNFEMSVAPGKPLKVVFANPGESPYSITYSVQPYRDAAGRTGLLLDSMHIFLDNADRDVEGPAMCYFTEYGK